MEENENVVNNEQNPTNVEERKGFSITSLVLGLCGLVVCGLPCGILAIIFSVLGMKRGGKGLAIAGLILGIVDVVFVLFYLSVRSSLKLI